MHLVLLYSCISGYRFLLFSVCSSSFLVFLVLYTTFSIASCSKDRPHNDACYPITNAKLQSLGSNTTTNNDSNSDTSNHSKNAAATTTINNDNDDNHDKNHSNVIAT